MKSKISINELKTIVEEFYEYTTEISITEDELFSDFDYLKDIITHREVTEQDYVNEVYKRLMFQIVFKPDSIKEQLETDYCEFCEDRELLMIKEMYKKLKKYIDISIEELEEK